jgi:serine/threonine protein kinase
MSTPFLLSFTFLSLRERGTLLTVSKAWCALLRVGSVHVPRRQAQTEAGNYELLRVLGVGSFSKVFLARHRTTGFVYALKCLNKMEQARLQRIRRVGYEVRCLRCVDHPSVARLITTFQDHANLYLVEEPVLGGDLFELLNGAAGKGLPPAAALFYAALLVQSITALHARGIVFRDVRPENILIATSGYIKLIDFGNAKRLAWHRRTFTLCGAPEYCAPEIISGTGHAHAVDWWSLGVLVFEMHLGDTPFRSDNPMDIYARILCRDSTLPIVFHAQGDGVDADMQACVEALLTVDPTARQTGTPASQAYFAGVDWDQLEQQRAPLPRACLALATGQEGNHTQLTCSTGIDTNPIKVTLAQVEWNRYCGEF